MKDILVRNIRQRHAPKRPEPVVNTANCKEANQIDDSSRVLRKSFIISFVAFLFLTLFMLSQLQGSEKECLGKFCVPDSLELNKRCGPYDTKTVVNLRIPKTGSTSFEILLIAASLNKTHYVFTLEDWDDSVPSLISKGAALMQRAQQKGYKSRANIGYSMDRRKEFFTNIVRKVANPSRKKRAIYSGHIFYLDWPSAGILYQRPKFATNFPSNWQKYLFPIPTQEFLEDIAQITFLREPKARLKSMYYYDRSTARSPAWREQWIKQYGDLSFEECLKHTECVESNELERWCSLQTEFLCGLNAECKRPITKKGLETAKYNLQNNILFFGILEKFDDSIAFFEDLLPYYMENITKIRGVKKARANIHPEYNQALSKEAIETLEKLCASDIELYSFALKLFNERIKECRRQRK